MIKLNRACHFLDWFIPPCKISTATPKSFPSVAMATSKSIFTAFISGYVPQCECFDFICQCVPPCKIVNWYFLMEPSRKNHAIELSLFLWRNARWHHWKCCLTQLWAATINNLHAPVIAHVGSGQFVSWQNGQARTNVCYKPEYGNVSWVWLVFCC